MHITLLTEYKYNSCIDAINNVVDKCKSLCFSQNSDWWVATHMNTGQKGYIPSNYVTKDDNSPQSQEWVAAFIVFCWLFNGKQLLAELLPSVLDIILGTE